MNLYVEEIMKHAAVSEQNLRVAILAGLAFPDLRRSLISEFAEELKNELENGGWSDCDVSRWKDFYWAKFRKKNWPLHVYVGICPYPRFEKHELGVVANRKEVTDDLRDKISKALKEQIGNSSIEDHCVWKKGIDSPYGNLNSENGLMALSKYQRAGTLTSLVKEIETIGAVIDLLFPTKAE